jgi:predicted house-cleaning NTP pyrophosphatase (Maf/HAM1 superfamily)
MRAYSPKEVDEYVASGSPLDKAGAYGIQDDYFHPVELEKMEGCYANVMGLPLCHLTRSMKVFGLIPVHDVPTECQRFINFQCKVFPEILGHQL